MKSHAKLHALDQPEPEPKWKLVMVSEGGTTHDYRTGFESEADALAAAEADDWRYVDENRFEWMLEVTEYLSEIQAQKKDRHTKEVEAESVAYTVCQRYGIETSDYSFGYIAGWSSDKETKELKGSLETIRKSAAEMIEGIDEKLKVLLAEKEAEVECEAEYPPRDEGIPVYRQTASYALEADELDITVLPMMQMWPVKRPLNMPSAAAMQITALLPSCGHKCLEHLPGTGLR